MEENNLVMQLCAKCGKLIWIPAFKISCSIMVFLCEKCYEGGDVK